MVSSRLAERLRELRTARGLTLQQVGNAIGVTRSAVWDWEQGRSQVPSLELPRVARALGVGVADLFNETTEASSYRAQLEDVVAQFRRVLEMRPERIEVNVYARGSDQPAQEHQAEEPTAAPYEGLPADYVPAPSQMFMRRFMEQWREMDEDERQEWLQFAEMVRAEEGKAE